jgi:hypothetical protein
MIYLLYLRCSKLYKQEYQTPEIARKTNHTEEYCDRYIKAYKKVEKLIKKMEPKKIARTLEIGISLVKEYLSLIKVEANFGEKEYLSVKWSIVI